MATAPAAPKGTPIVEPARKVTNGDEPVESKHDKFVRLAIDRRAKSIQRINQIGALANKAQYEYTDDEVARLLKPIEDALQGARNRFAGILDRKAQMTL